MGAAVLPSEETTLSSTPFTVAVTKVLDAAGIPPVKTVEFPDYDAGWRVESPGYTAHGRLPRRMGQPPRRTRPVTPGEARRGPVRPGEARREQEVTRLRRMLAEKPRECVLLNRRPDAAAAAIAALHHDNALLLRDPGEPHPGSGRAQRKRC